VKMFTIRGKYTSALFTIDDIEQECISQVFNACNHPAFINPIVLQPDCHAGAGCTIGFTMSLENIDYVIPNIVGVDVGCGMLACNIGTNLSKPIEQIDIDIQEKVPMGFSSHKTPLINIERDKQFNNDICTELRKDYDITGLLRTIKASGTKSSCGIGTLGGGNHFISIDKCEITGDYWINIHTGSRNLGKKVCEHFQDLAIANFEGMHLANYHKEVEYIVSNFSGTDISSAITAAKQKLDAHRPLPKELSYLQGQDKTDYLDAMAVAQLYAKYNRKYILQSILQILDAEPMEQIESVHNYISFQDNIIRKGAISSYVNQKMVIPLNMRDGVLVCEGKSNPEWNYSAPHGAGRLMSRSKAKKEVKLDAYKNSMAGVYSTCICDSTLDESPFAYKDSEMIKSAIEPTATILTQLKPVLNIKSK
jgi:tRNA-splicing ligase RtcB